MTPTACKAPLLFTTAAALLLSFSSRVFAEPYIFDTSQVETATLTISPSVQKADDATESLDLFSSILERIVGTAPAKSDTLEAGIVFATAADFPELAREAGLKPGDSLRREEYLLRTSGKRLLVVGATPIAVRRAMADILHRWGYRQFFPSPEWEILPPAGPLSLDVDTVERPAFVMRDLFTTSFLEGEEEAYERWRELNRMGRGFLLNTRHSYEKIYKRHKALFDAHPEYFGLVDGERQIASKTSRFKFNAANEEVLQLIENDAREQFEAPDAIDSISMDPSDFGGWDNSGEAFRTLGKPSNQAVTLANRVAKKVAAPLGRYVGMYAYYDHQFPPDIEVEPNIIVSFATRFLKPDQDLYRHITAWQEKGVRQIGIREYASVFEWDLAMPSRALGGNLAYLDQSLRRYKDLGATFYTSESQNAWGAYGLGYYTMAQLLWNPQQEAQAIVDDFLHKAFGPAASPMATFYSRLNGADSVMARYQSPAWFYAPLLEALTAAKGSVQVEKRIVSLLAYVRYVELFSILERSPFAQKQAALEELYSHLFRAAPLRVLPTRAMMLHPKVGLRRTHARLKHQSQADYVKAIAEAANSPLTMEELLSFARQAIASERATLPQATTLPEPIRTAAAPWIRNSAAFTFPLKAAEKVEAQIALRRFGFSGFPRYVILHTGKQGEALILQRGQMQQEKETITLTATEGGNYTVIFETTPNLIQCTATKPYYLNPCADTGTIDFVTYRGTIHFAVPRGESASVAIGGQEKETIFASVAVNDKTVAKGRNLDGFTPLEKLIVAPEDAPARVRITLRTPTEGYFEDHFLQFQGDFQTPISLAPLP